MKKNYFLVFVGMLMMALTMNGKEFSFDFKSKIVGGWSVSPSPSGFESTGSERGMQFSKAEAALTLKGAKGVSKVVVTVSSNSADQTLEVKVGGKSWGTEALAKENNAVKSFSGEAADGDIVITITKGAKSSWVRSVVVTADEAGEDEGEEDDKDLDPEYKYGEPTTLLPTGTVGSNQAYSFVQNNIKVSATAGGQAEEYFGCNAGNELTFTATKEMKAIVVKGFIKKDFSATTSNGDIEYADAEDNDEGVEGDPVLMVKDINSKTVTLSCVKQLRCYGVDVYFEDNPEVEIDHSGEGGGEEEEEYSHDYEPTTKSDIVITFDSLYYSDYSEDLGYDCSYLYFTADEFEMEMVAFKPSVEGKGIAPGTYPINSTYNEGTIQASPGGDDYYDYPTYIATGFEYDEDYGWYYTTSYYLVSGTVTVENDAKGVKYTIDAKSYYGSTIKATFIGKAMAYDEEEGGGGEEEEYTYEYEPEEATTINFSADTMLYLDQSEDYGFEYTALYMEDDYSYIELGVFAPCVEGKGIAVGTYQINDSQEPGTVMASPGSDDYYDYASVYCTNFVEGEEGWYWDTYYLMSGTVKVEDDPEGVKVTVDAKTYNGSTFKATFIGKAEKYEDPETGIEEVKDEKGNEFVKRVEKGRIVIVRGEKKFGVDGVEIK